MAKAKIVLVCILCLSFCLNLFGQHCIVDKAESQIGVREVGNNRGDSVVKYLNTTGLGGGYAWCAAFVNWVYQGCGISTPEDKAAWSPSWFPDERTVWKRQDVEGINPTAGDAFGIYFSSKSRIAHVGIVANVTKDYFVTIEGNTNEGGAREGDGVYKKRRPKRAVYKVSRWNDRQCDCQSMNEFNKWILEYVKFAL